jgi:hypothetical protein
MKAPKPEQCPYCGCREFLHENKSPWRAFVDSWICAVCDFVVPPVVEKSVTNLSRSPKVSNDA